MNQSKNQAPENGATPMQVDVNGCFAIRGVRVVDSSKGPFVSMPGYKTSKGYSDVCFPCTKEFRQQFNQAVLDAYQQEMAAVFQRGQSQENAGPPQEEQDEPMLPDMSM